MNLFDIAARAVRVLPAESAHRFTINALKTGLAKPKPHLDDPRLAVTLKKSGLKLPNPIGLAAGFDKNAEVFAEMLAFGFGFVECGTVTPLPQAGNPRPRLFRLGEDRAVINRMGFNNDGLEAFAARLDRRGAGVVGANIGANKDAADRIADYVTGLRRLWGRADYFTINVSSPNTPGLRDLQGEAFLDELLARTVEARDAAGAGAAILLKIAPDMALDALDAVCATAQRRGVQALVVSNTTVARPASLREQGLARETGGLSGRPLFGPATRMLAQTRLRVGEALPLIGVGGVDSAEAAWTKIRAGASLVQLYSALVYEGPGLVGRIKDGLLRRMSEAGVASLRHAVGRDAADLARGD